MAQPARAPLSMEPLKSTLSTRWSTPLHSKPRAMGLIGHATRTGPTVRFGDEYTEDGSWGAEEGGNKEYTTDTGRLVRWNGDRGFGFIRPDDGGEDLFAHVTSLVDGEESVTRGDFVTFVKEWNDRTGKYEALEVRVDGTKEREIPVEENGVVLRWNGDRGFGFIHPEAGGEDIFAHVTNCAAGEEPGQADKVAFIKEYNDRKGKYEATNIRILERGTGELPKEGPGDTAVEGKGQLVRWNDERGFGFVKPEDGGEDLFAHISSLVDGEGSVKESNMVTYLKDFNEKKGNYQAYQVKYAGEGPALDEWGNEEGGEEGEEEGAEEGAEETSEPVG